jgi:hypothetical protein
MSESPPTGFRVHRHRVVEISPARGGHAGRHRHADHRRILPLRSSCSTSRNSTSSPFRRFSPSRSLRFSSRPWSRTSLWATGCDRRLRPEPILFNFGWENTLYLPGQTPAYTYSDMNGYGHFVPALFWSIAYWLSIFALLGVLSIAYTRRGALKTPWRRALSWRLAVPGWHRQPCSSR